MKSFIKLFALVIFCDFGWLLTNLISIVDGKKSPPLIEERNHRKNHGSLSECYFGKEHKELGSSWFPDLGPPFGVMYCTKCECLSVKKKRRIIGRVQCRNIAKECEELTCEEQLQLPGRCCKTCSNSTQFSDVVQDSGISTIEEEDKTFKNFASIFNAQTSRIFRKEDKGNSSEYASNELATGRFTLHRRNLYFSLYATTRPKVIQFSDQLGNILEEQVISSGGSSYQNATGKVCGVWHRIAREYKRLLREEKMLVTLIWEKGDFSLTASILRHRSLTTEIFSSLMVPSDKSRAFGGTAIVSISNVSPSIHILIVFSGFVEKTETSFTLKVESMDKHLTIIDEVVRVEKFNSEVFEVEVRAGVSWSDLQALAQQRLVVSIASRSSNHKLEGRIIPKLHCELFQAVLTYSLNSPPKEAYRYAGVLGNAWMFIDQNGTLQFQVTLHGISNGIVELVTSRHYTVVEDLTRLGLSKGIISYMSPKNLEHLYNEELAVNVLRAEDISGASIIRGRLHSRFVADGRDGGSPLILTRTNFSHSSNIAGLIWVNIDNYCNVEYDVTISEEDVSRYHLELYLEQVPSITLGIPPTRRLVDEFDGVTVLEGSLDSLSPLEFSRLKTSAVYFDIWDVKLDHSVLKAHWINVTIPEKCMVVDTGTGPGPGAGLGSVSSVGTRTGPLDNNSIPSTNQLSNDESDPVEITKCLHGGQFYETGSQWTSTIEECTMCNCNRGIVKCDRILCPPINCSIQFTRSSPCCPACSSTVLGDTTSIKVDNAVGACQLGGQLFNAGTSWHPYIPPNGFDTCAVCFCDITTLKVKCQKVDCPVLNCDDRKAIRPPKSCCKICPNKTRDTQIMYDTPLADQLQDSVRREMDLLNAGGCKLYSGLYENGQHWYPRLYSHGEYPCITCNCKDGKVTCDRKKCSKRSCDDQCCPTKTKCSKYKTRNHTRRTEMHS